MIIGKFFFLIVVLFFFALIVILLKVFKVKVKSYRQVYLVIFGIMFVVLVSVVSWDNSKQDKEDRINNDIIKLLNCHKNIELDRNGCKTKTFDFINNVNRGQENKTEYVKILREKFNILIKEWEDYYQKEFNAYKFKEDMNIVDRFFIKRLYDLKYE
jgi:hypothetical protein